jgi:hypothetical protein
MFGRAGKFQRQSGTRRYGWLAIADVLYGGQPPFFAPLAKNGCLSPVLLIRVHPRPNFLLLISIRAVQPPHFSFSF